MARKSLKLTEGMKRALEIEVFEPELPCAVVAERAGVSLVTLYEYHINPLYKAEKERMLKDKFESYEALALAGLENLLMESNFNAVKYVLDNRGYDAPQKIEVDANVIKVSITDD